MDISDKQGGITYGRFRTDRIRNVVLLGHGGAGKTTLAEAMAYLAGMTNRLGRVKMEIPSAILTKKR